MTLAVLRYHSLWANSLRCQAGTRGYTPGFLSCRKFMMSLSFSGCRVTWFPPLQRVFSGTAAQKRRCDGGRVWMGTCLGWVLLFAAAEKSPQFWEAELSPGEELSHLWQFCGWDICPHQQRLCPTSPAPSAVAGTERWSDQAGSPLSSPILLFPVAPHPGTASSALPVQLRNGKWLCLIWLALCSEQVFEYLCLTNPLYSNHRAKGALGLQEGELRKASL